MRLSAVLSKPSVAEFTEVEGFISKKLPIGKQRKITVGQVALHYRCDNCGGVRTFLSSSDLYCIGVNLRQISIDCVLKCVGDKCESSVAAWFLVECEDGEDTDNDKKKVSSYIYGNAPRVRILKHREKLSEQVGLVGNEYDNYTELLEKSEHSYRDGLGSGATVYLRKVFESITTKSADAVGISYDTHKGGNPKNFFILLEKVDEQCSIIPPLFSANGYKLYRELSDVVHGNYDEQLGLQKYEAFRQLVVGIIKNIKNNEEMASAIDSLGWNKSGGGDNGDK